MWKPRTSTCTTREAYIEILPLTDIGAHTHKIIKHTERNCPSSTSVEYLHR